MSASEDKCQSHEGRRCDEPFTVTRASSSDRPSSDDNSDSPVDASPSQISAFPAPAGLGVWSDLLSGESAGRQYQQLVRRTKLHHRTYQLVVTQEPRTAAEFGQHDMSRIPLSPPLFVQLVVRDNMGVEIPADAELPFLVARITLHSGLSHDLQDLYSNSELYGTTISTPDTLQDMSGAFGAYFIFPDVGVRRRGCWRLHVSLLRIAHVGSATVLDNGDASTCLAGVWTGPFNVVPAETYVAPEMTRMTRHFQNQGVRMFTSNTVVPR